MVPCREPQSNPRPNLFLRGVWIADHRGMPHRLSPKANRGSGTRAPKTLFTIGYEGRAAEGLLAMLKKHKVAVLVDVRELPLSRRRGFSKTSLAEILAASGIEYVHERTLGAPRTLRHWARRTGQLSKFLVRYRSHLHGHLDAVRALGDVASSKRVCLLCFESDAHRCHRSVVARSIRAAMRGRIQHL